MWNWKKKAEEASHDGLVLGQKAIVTGDTVGMGHEYEAGTEVTLASYDPEDRSWRCDADGDYWYVHTKDLEPLVKPPTDKELKAALKSIEQSARNARNARKS